MSEFLQNLIITDKIASFINDVIVETEEEERHDKLVNEIKRMEENDLYTKPESYKQKLREVGLLEVVIELEGINMEK